MAYTLITNYLKKYIYLWQFGTGNAGLDSWYNNIYNMNMSVWLLYYLGLEHRFPP